MILALLIVSCLLAMLLALPLIRNMNKYKDFPGPSALLSLPIFGHLPLLHLYSNPIRKLTEFQRRYGDMFRCDIGSKPTIYLCSYDLVEEAFKMDEFTKREGVAKMLPKGMLLLTVNLQLRPGSHW